MGNDRRKVIEVLIPSGCNYAIVSEVVPKKPGTKIHEFSPKIKLMQIDFPSSAEELILQLDIKNIKWKDLIFDDHRSYHGVFKKDTIFDGDMVKINIGDRVKDPDNYSKKLSKIDRMLIIRNDAISYNNPYHYRFGFKRPIMKQNRPTSWSFGPPKK